MGKPITLDTATGAIQSSSKAAPKSSEPQPVALPKSDWARSKKRHDDFFVFEGALIYLKFPSDLGPIEAAQSEIAERGIALQRMVNIDKSDTVGKKSADIIEMAEANAGALSTEEQKALKEEVAQMNILSLEFSYSLAAACICGWEGAPVEYSPEAIDDLPAELLGKWTPLILEKMSLTEAESRFLQTRSKRF